MLRNTQYGIIGWRILPSGRLPSWNIRLICASEYVASPERALVRLALLRHAPSSFWTRHTTPAR
jgi:hypothetical protein